MSKVDEVMSAVYAYGCARADERDTPTAENVRTVIAASASLREMIAAALADAERKGAEQMREACEKAVWLTNEAVTAACRDIAIAVAENCGSVPQLTHPHIYIGVRKLLAANGLEVRRG